MILCPSELAGVVGRESVVRLIVEIHDEGVIALSAHPPEVSESDSVISDGCKSCIHRVTRAAVGCSVELTDLLVEDVDVGCHVELPGLNNSYARSDALVLTNQHIDFILQVVDNDSQVDDR